MRLLNKTEGDLSKEPPVKTGGIAGFRLCLSACGGYFHLPVKTGSIEIGRINRFFAALRMTDKIGVKTGMTKSHRNELRDRTEFNTIGRAGRRRPARKDLDFYNHFLYNGLITKPL